MLLGDIFIFDVQAGSIRSIPTDATKELKFQSSSNISVTTKVDQIAALVMDHQGKLNLVSYTKDADKVQVIQRLV